MSLPRDATVSISVMSPSTPISARMLSRTVQRCLRIIPDFFQPYCDNAPLSTAGMPWPPLRRLCRSCEDTSLLSMLRYHNRLPLGCPHHFHEDALAPSCYPILSITATLHCPYRKDAPVFNAEMPSPTPWLCAVAGARRFLLWGCPCNQCRDALTTPGRIPSQTQWLCAVPYCGFAQLSNARMPLQ
jgi:hypothetical protein